MARPKNSEGYTPEFRKTLMTFIVSYLRDNGRTPSIRDMGRHFALSGGGIFFYLEKMKADGLIESTQNRPMRITAEGFALAGIGRPVWQDLPTPVNEGPNEYLPEVS